MDIQTYQEELNKTIDQAPDSYRSGYIVSTFGSEERARNIEKYYILEETVVVADANTTLFGNGTDLHLKATWRIRPKTSEELLNDRANKIIEKHTTTFNNCIVCNEPILHKDEEVDTIHGYYHGYPYDCLNGRQAML